MHPAIGRWDLCSGDRLPKARSRWRNPRVALTFTIHGSATWAPAGCAAASRSSLRRDPPHFPGTRDPGSPLSPAPPLGLPAPARNLGRSRARASTAGQDLPRAPGGARARDEADHARSPSQRTIGTPVRGKKRWTRLPNAEISFCLSNCRCARSERCPARCWQSRPLTTPPGSAPSQAPRDPRGGRADPGGGWGTAEARAAGEGSGEKSGGAGRAQWVRSIARSQ